MNDERNIVSEVITEVSIIRLAGEEADIVESIREYFALGESKGYKNLRFSYDPYGSPEEECSYCDCGIDTPSLNLIGERLETDKELASRLRAEQKERERKEREAKQAAEKKVRTTEKEKKELARLIKKYGVPE